MTTTSSGSPVRRARSTDPPSSPVLTSPSVPADYELGRLYQAKGDWALAREQYELVMSGKHLEVNTAKKGKGKVSLQVRARLAVLFLPSYA